VRLCGAHRKPVHGLHAHGSGCTPTGHPAGARAPSQRQQESVPTHLAFSSLTHDFMACAAPKVYENTNVSNEYRSDSCYCLITMTISIIAFDIVFCL
jgi:hypothetical protein